MPAPYCSIDRSEQFTPHAILSDVISWLALQTCKFSAGTTAQILALRYAHGKAQLARAIKASGGVHGGSCRWWRSYWCSCLAVCNKMKAQIILTTDAAPAAPEWALASSATAANRRSGAGLGCALADPQRGRSLRCAETFFRPIPLLATFMLAV
jgi:hypothetical protein